MYKNLSGQKIRVFAFDRATALPVSGDALNITCKVSIDNAAAVDLEDVNPTETEDGYYLFDLTKAETNGNTLDFYPESSTSGVQVITVNHDRQTLIDNNAPQAVVTGYAGYFGASYFGGGSLGGSSDPPSDPSLCLITFTVWGDEGVMPDAVVRAKLERPYALTLNHEAARVQHRAVTDENGQARLELIRLDQFQFGGVYLIEIYGDNAQLLSSRRVTVPNLSSTSSVNLVTVG